MNENRTTLRRNALSEPLSLRSGITLPNRVAKAATSEHLADRRGAPTNQLITAYRTLALSGAGLLISGNVMVDGAGEAGDDRFDLRVGQGARRLEEPVATDGEGHLGRAVDVVTTPG